MKKVFILILLLISLSGCTGNRFTVTFDTNGGNVIEKMTVSRNKVIKNLEIPIKDHHIFKGWYFDSEFEEPFLNDFTVDTHILLYAKWVPAQYSIYFDSRGGKVDGDEYFTISKPFGATFELPTPTKYGFTFVGWYESNTGNIYESTTMTAGDMSLNLNRIHYPQKFLPTDYSDGKDDGTGGITFYTEAELKAQRLRNLDTFEERLRGNTTFNYDLIEDPTTENFVLTPQYTGYTYTKACADYIEKHDLANVQESNGGWWVLEDVSPELLNGYGIHLNCDNSPLTNNPFMSKTDFSILYSCYPIYNWESLLYRKIEVRYDSQFSNLYRILFTSHTQQEGKFGLKVVVDEKGNPIIRGGYHAIDKDGHYIYDENGKPVQKLYGTELKDDGKPIYAKSLYAQWIEDN